MFTDPLTDCDLYWIGYIHADGSLSYGNRASTLQFGQKHREPVEALCQYIGAGEIKFRGGETNFGKREQYYFTSRKSVERLLELGVKKELRLSIYASKHFWRGMIDGDGSILLAKYETKHGTQLFPSVSLCVNDYDTNMFISYLKSIGLNKVPKILKCPGINRVAVSGEFAAYLCKLLYENEYSALNYKQNAANKAMKFRVVYKKMSRLLENTQGILYSAK